MAFNPDVGAARFKLLADRLARIPRIAAVPRGEAPEAESLAHALVDIHRVSTRLSTDLIPRLFRPGATDEDMEEILHEIGVQLREFLESGRGIWDLDERFGIWMNDSG